MVKDGRSALTQDFDSDDEGQALADDELQEADVAGTAGLEGEQDAQPGQTAEERIGEASASEPDSEEEEEEATETGKRGRVKKVLSEEKLKRIKEAYAKRGIVYVSRIPPHMKPQKLRQLLSQYGAVNRVYCAPEAQSARSDRKRKGKDTGKNFVEGWVEFEDKRIAKRISLALNNKQIGGRKRSAYHYDLWSLKYLPKFKWDHLTEEINYQKAVREQKLVAEISAAKRERDFYLSRVDRAKAVDAIKERKQKQAQAQGGEGAAPLAAASAPAGGEGAGAHTIRHYGQRRAKPDPVSDASAPRMADDVLAMLAQSRKKQRAG